MLMYSWHFVSPRSVSGGELQSPCGAE
jgi:hypothetical protein